MINKVYLSDVSEAGQMKRDDLSLQKQPTEQPEQQSDLVAGQLGVRFVCVLQFTRLGVRQVSLTAVSCNTVSVSLSQSLTCLYLTYCGRSL